MLVDINEYLNNKLKLEVKDNWQIFPVKSRGIDFVGYVFYHTHGRKSIKQSLARQVANAKRHPNQEKHERSIASYWGWCKHCDSINLTEKLFKNTEYENKLTLDQSKFTHWEEMDISLQYNIEEVIDEEGQEII